MKIVRIDGIKGLINALFICAGLIAGFVIAPGYLAMHLWNKYLVNLLQFPTLNHLQGVLLWGIVAITYCILSKEGFAVYFKDAPNELSEEEINSIVKNAEINKKMKMMNRLMAKHDKFEVNKDEIKKNSSLVSSPISLNKKNSVEESKDEKVSNIK